MLKKIIDRLESFFGSQKPPYWVIVATKEPKCVYYFGSFGDRTEAQEMQHGYVEDLQAEQAQGISVSIERCTPNELTVCELES